MTICQFPLAPSEKQEEPIGDERKNYWDQPLKGPFVQNLDYGGEKS
jgi:hypothetical protein